MIILHVEFTVDTGSEFTDNQALELLKGMLDKFNEKLPKGKMQLKCTGEENVKIKAE